MTNQTVMGMPIEGEIPASYTPLAALVIMKMLDNDGDPIYIARATGGLSSVECLGMAVYAEECLKAGWFTSEEE